MKEKVVFYKKKLYKSLVDSNKCTTFASAIKEHHFPRLRIIFLIYCNGV